MKILNTFLYIELTDDEIDTFNYIFIHDKSHFAPVVTNYLQLSYDDIDLVMAAFNEVQDEVWKQRCENLYNHFEEVLRTNSVYTEIMKQRLHIKMSIAAEKYYTLLKEGEDADPIVKEKLKVKLDILAAPFCENPAYYSFLKMERMAAGL